MTRPPTEKKNWQRKRKLKWRDVYCRARLMPNWKKYRKHQAWRLSRKP